MPNPEDGDDDDRAAFIEGMSTAISHVLDDPGALWIEYRVVSQPTMVFVAADGSTEVRTGALGPPKLVEELRALES